MGEGVRGVWGMRVGVWGCGCAKGMGHVGGYRKGEGRGKEGGACMCVRMFWRGSACAYLHVCACMHACVFERTSTCPNEHVLKQVHMYENACIRTHAPL